MDAPESTPISPTEAAEPTAAAPKKKRLNERLTDAIERNDPQAIRLLLLDHPGTTEITSRREVSPTVRCVYRRVRGLDRPDPALARAAQLFAAKPCLTPLGLAVEKGHLGCVEALLPHTDPNASANEFDDTALAMAAQIGSPSIVRALLPVSNARQGDYKGQTALIWAVRAGHPECVRLLLPACDPNVSDNDERKTALMWAVQENQLACVEALLPSVDANVRDPSGWTALMHAAHAGRIDCLKALLPASDPLARSRRGRSALMLAASQGHAACVQELLGVSDVNARTKDEGEEGEERAWSALAGAADGGHTDCVRLLVPHCDAAMRREALEIAKLALKIAKQKVANRNRARAAEWGLSECSEQETPHSISISGVVEILEMAVQMQAHDDQARGAKRNAATPQPGRPRRSIWRRTIGFFFR
jgi:hypothetical protein